MPSDRKVKLILVLGALAPLALVVWSVISVAPSAARLPDGSTLQVLAVSAGQAKFSTEKWWHQPVRRVLPARFQSLVPPTVTYSSVGPADSITVYFQIRRNSKSTALNPMRAAAAVDDSGFRFPTQRRWLTLGTWPGKQVHGIILEAFPRRQRRFTLCFVDPNSQTLATLRVPNPIYRRFPQWTPDRLPITRTNGRMTLTLTKLTEESFSLDERWIRPEWQMETAEPAWQRTLPTPAQFVDVTGNRGPFLSPREHAWKMKVLVARERREDFGPDERFRLERLLVPEAAVFEPLDFTTNVLGINFTVFGLGRSGRLVISNQLTRTMLPLNPKETLGWSSVLDAHNAGGTNGWECWASARPFIVLEASGVKTNDEITLWLSDSDGREIKLDDSKGFYGRSGPPGRRLYARSFSVLPGTQWISLEIVVNRNLEFEFLIDPAEIRK